MSARLPAVLVLVILLAHVAVYVPCLQDDAFISFRYAQNLVDGHGLVFNPGERVEGYTNFLWTICMAFPLSLGFSVESFSIVVGVLGLVLLVFLTWQLAAQRAGAWVGLACIPPLLLALDAPLVLEATQGLETSFFAFFVLAMVAATLNEAENPEARPLSALFGALALLTRPEGVLIYGLTQGIRLLHERRLPQAGQRWGWALVLLVVLGQLVIRLAYYGQPLPNTFYAKVGGGSETWLRGLDYLWRFAWSHKVFVLLTICGALALLVRESRSLRTWVFVGTAAVWEAYVIWVGGDFKVTWRFMQPMMALYALLVLDVLLLARERLIIPVQVPGFNLTTKTVEDGGIHRIDQSHPTPRITGTVQVPGVNLTTKTVEDGGIHRIDQSHPTPRITGTTGAAVGLVALALWAVLDAVPEYKRSRSEARFRADVTVMRTMIGQWLGANAQPHTVLAIHSAGTIPYYAGLPTIDMWGLADPHIARREMPDMGKGMAGHEKSDPDYVFERKPTLYVPEEFLYTKEARRLPVPSDFPADFEENYRSASVPIEDGWFNFFERVVP